MAWNKHLIRLIALLLIQVLILNQLQFFGLCHPYVFILFLLMMPISLPRSIDLIIAALVGLVMDLFCNSLGVHMAACILIAFLRRPMITNLVMDETRLRGDINSVALGRIGFFKYAIVLIFVYHTAVVLLCAWSFAHIGFNLLQILLSSLVSGLMIIGYDILQSK